KSQQKSSSQNNLSITELTQSLHNFHPNNPLISELLPLTPTEDETTTNEQQQSQKSYSQAARPKLNPSFDFLANFPVSKEMQKNTKLQTDISRKLFNFLKDHLYN